MLVVTRQVGEDIVIGDPKNPLGFIRIVEARGDRIRIGIDLPASIQINRKEVAERIRQGSGITCAEPVGACCPSASHQPDQTASSKAMSRPTAHKPSASDSQPSGGRGVCGKRNAH